MQTQVQSTLLDLVHTFSSFTDNDREVVALVTYLVNSGRVRLCGTFAGAATDLSPPSPTPPQPPLLLSLPPNHTLAEVGIAGAADPNNTPVVIPITGVTQDESMTPATPLPP